MLRKYIAIAMAPLLALLLAVYQQVGAVNAGYRLEDLRAEMARVTVQRESLECDVASMRSPERLLAKAQEWEMEFELPAARIAMEGENWGAHQP